MKYIIFLFCLLFVLQVQASWWCSCIWPKRKRSKTSRGAKTLVGNEVASDSMDEEDIASDVTAQAVGSDSNNSSTLMVNHIQEQSDSSPVRLTLVPKQRPTNKKKKGAIPELQDEDNSVGDAPVEGTNVEEGDSSQEQLTLVKDNPFQELIKNKDYEEIEKLGNRMTNEELVRQLFPVITTVEHYNGLKEFLKRRGMVSDFYLNGNMEVVERDYR